MHERRGTPAITERCREDSSRQHRNVALDRNTDTHRHSWNGTRDHTSPGFWSNIPIVLLGGRVIAHKPPRDAVVRAERPAILV